MTPPILETQSMKEPRGKRESGFNRLQIAIIAISNERITAPLISR